MCCIYKIRNIVFVSFYLWLNKKRVFVSRSLVFVIFFRLLMCCNVLKFNWMRFKRLYYCLCVLYCIYLIDNYLMYFWYCWNLCRFVSFFFFCNFFNFGNMFFSNWKMMFELMYGMILSEKILSLEMFFFVSVLVYVIIFFFFASDFANVVLSTSLIGMYVFIRDSINSVKIVVIFFGNFLLKKFFIFVLLFGFLFCLFDIARVAFGLV